MINEAQREAASSSTLGSTGSQIQDAWVNEQLFLDGFLRNDCSLDRKGVSNAV